MKYDKVNKDLAEQILSDREHHIRNPYACTGDKVIRRDNNRDRENFHRPAYVRDIEKIMHCPYYNRYTDKTQVFSFYKNDDISRRALHVQLVSRIARNIGTALNLNNDLIEAIALGHDIGHTPFGHAGERMLSRLYHGNTGRYFNHNVHSVRVLDRLFSRNISLQTLDGILCHNGEFEKQEYIPKQEIGFKEFDDIVESCYQNDKNIGTLIPMTLEGCVVRICDMIAYLGKDRQDARLANIIGADTGFSDNGIGVENAEMTNNLVVNIINNSYGKNYIRLDEEYYDAIKMAKKENYEIIYFNEQTEVQYKKYLEPMFEEIYDRLLKDLKSGKRDSVIYTHHVDFINQHRRYYDNGIDYGTEQPDDIVVDYIASMTDDYFVDLYDYLFPDGKNMIRYIPYFNIN